MTIWLGPIKEILLQNMNKIELTAKCSKNWFYIDFQSEREIRTFKTLD